MRIGFVGLTHLGLCMSIAARKLNFEVILSDINPQRIKSAREAKFDVAEPGVRDFLLDAGALFMIVDDLESMEDTDLVVVAVDTTLDEIGENDESEVREILSKLYDAVGAEIPVVLASQVRPGFCRSIKLPFKSLTYLMETLVFGRGLERAQHPERLVVGCEVPSKALPGPVQMYLDAFKCPIHVMNYESAELSKLSANFLLAASICAANAIAELAENVGADWAAMEAGLREDARIGKNAYITPGPGIGGSNIARDLYGVMQMSLNTDVSGNFAAAMLESSNYMRRWAVRQVTDLRIDQDTAVIGLLGVAYKPGTSSIRDSAGLAVIEGLAPRFRILLHDPVVDTQQLAQSGKLLRAATVEEVLTEAHVVIIGTPYLRYRAEIEGTDLKGKPPIFVDPYRLLKQDWASTNECTLFQLGVDRDILAP